MRTLIPVKQLSTQQLDDLREYVEADLKKKAAIDHPAVKDWVSRQLLPWTDLVIVHAAQAGILTDFWGCGAQVASTLLVYVPNTALRNTQYVGIYGINIRDTNPAVIKILFQTGGGASTLGNWNVEHIYGQEVPEAVTPEYIYYPGNSIIQIQLLPNTVGKAVGADGVSDHVVLIGLICQPAGEVVSM